MDEETFLEIREIYLKSLRLFRKAKKLRAMSITQQR